MNNSVRTFIKNRVESIYKTFESSSGNMILLTTAIGVFLSAVAQSLAVVFNKKYSVSQKAFMIPQELTECAISIGTLFVTALVLKKTADKFVECGKIIPKDLKLYLTKNNAIKNIGTSKFNVESKINNIKNDIIESDKYKKSSVSAKKKLLLPAEQALVQYTQSKDATSSIVTTAGSVISTSIFVPLIRNNVASKLQGVNIEIIDNIRNQKTLNEKNNLTKRNNFNYNNYVLNGKGMRV